MRVNILVEVDIEPFAGNPSDDEQRAACVEAIANALRVGGRGVGFTHKLESTASILLAQGGVKVLEVTHYLATLKPASQPLPRLDPAAGPKRYTYLTEFSRESHPSADLVARIMAAAPGVQDVSWHNDVAPSWSRPSPADPDGEAGIRFMVHPENPADRESPTYARFDVFREGRGDSLYHGDDFEQAIKTFRSATFVLTFEQFRATGRDVPDLRAFDWYPTDPADPRAVPGRVYLETLYIFDAGETAVPTGRRFSLILGREEWVDDDLEAIERRLYDWAASEDYFKVSP